MLLDAPNLDLVDTETEMVDLLGLVASGLDVGSSGRVDAGSDAQRACELLSSVLREICRLLPGSVPARYWALDDLACDSVLRGRDRVTLQGACGWLEGGGGTDRFRIDVALGRESPLYSYKFMLSSTGVQVLYVGKTAQGWVIKGP